jgi:predicted Zn-dependent protease
MDPADISRKSLLNIDGDYVEARYSSVIYKDFNTDTNETSSITREGISLRVVDKNRLKSAHTNTRKTPDEMLGSAPWTPLNSYRLPFPCTYEEPPPDPIELPVDLTTDTLGSLPHKCVKARLESLTVYEHIWTNHGTDIYHGRSAVFVRIFVTPVPGLTIVYFFAYPGEDIKKNLESLCFNVQKSRDYHPLSPGTYDVVLSPHVTGMIFHELLHSFEGSTPHLQFPSFLSVFDNPAAERLGGYTFDAEGCKASRTPLVNKGVVTGCLASIFHPGYRKPTGNARASSFDVEPIPRQSNTEVDINAGHYTEEELLETIGNGIYLDQIGQGTAFPGNITYFSNTVAYRIEKGEICEPVLGVAFGGNLHHLVNTIQCAAKNYTVYPTVCWKNNQRLFTTMRAPSILIREMPIYTSSKS